MAKGSSAVAYLLLGTAIAGIVAYYYFVVRKRQQQPQGGEELPPYIGYSPFGEIGGYQGPEAGEEGEQPIQTQVLHPAVEVFGEVR